jgi:hypothetical protein
LGNFVDRGCSSREELLEIEEIELDGDGGDKKQ